MVVTFWATWQGRQLPPQHAIKMVSVLGPPRKMLEVTISRIRHLEYMVSKTMLFQPNVQGVKYRSIDLGTRAGLDPGPWLQQAPGPGPACTKCLQEAVTSAPPMLPPLHIAGDCVVATTSSKLAEQSKEAD